MVARFAGATLGLLAFSIATAAGLLARNPAEVTLSRSILALFVFCVIGFVLGGAAQSVIAEHEREQEAETRRRYEQGPSAADDGGAAETEAR